MNTFCARALISCKYLSSPQYVPKFCRLSQAVSLVTMWFGLDRQTSAHINHLTYFSYSKYTVTENGRMALYLRSNYFRYVYNHHHRERNDHRCFPTRERFDRQTKQSLDSCTFDDWFDLWHLYINLLWNHCFWTRLSIRGTWVYGFSSFWKYFRCE